MDGEHQTERKNMRFLVLVARILFSAIFILASLSLFASETIEYAASRGVPWANISVPLAGILALAGGISVLLGYHAKIGGLLLVLFLIPVTLFIHNFWTYSNLEDIQNQWIMFMKNVSILGGAILISYFGAGPYSLDSFRRKYARHHRPHIARKAA